MYKLFIVLVVLFQSPLLFSASECQKAITAETKESANLKNLILDKEFFTNYAGMEGYVRFANEHFKGDMKKAYINLSTFLDKKKLRELNWRKFIGSTKDFRDLEDLILDKSTDFFTNYAGMKNFVRLANELFGGDMTRAYINVFVLNRKEFKKLKWKPFKGNTQKFKDLENLISDKEFMESHFDIKGYVNFADEYFDGDMTNAFLNIFAVSNQEKLRKLNWRKFIGSTKDFRDLENLILDKSADFFTNYAGMEGYIRFANEHFKGDMARAYINVSAILGKNKLKNLNWKLVKGNTKDFAISKNLILDENGDIIKNYADMNGYVSFADEHFKGDMRGAFNNISVLLGKEKTRELNWHYFEGSTKEFRGLKNLILDKRFFSNYSSMHGYARFADEHFKGDMVRAYTNVLILSEKEEFTKLKWYQFRGSTQDFWDLKNRILDKKENVFSRYYNMKGFVLLANECFDGNMTNAFLNVSVILGGQKAMKNLGWKQFEGNTTQYQSLILVFQETPLGVLKGFKSQKMLADKIFNGNTKLTYRNVSVLSSELLDHKKDFRKLDWKEGFF